MNERVFIKQLLFSLSRLGSIGLISVLICRPALSMIVALDPGHGGVDTGAVYGPAKEADLVLKVAKELKTQLENDSSLTVHLTRDSDHPLPLSERVDIAEKVNADVFVSLHANATPDRRAKGIEIFFQNSLPPDEDALLLASSESNLSLNADSQSRSSELENNLEPSKKTDLHLILEDLKRQARLHKSLNLTEIIRSSLKPALGKSNPTIKQAPFYVITRTSMPAVLIELGFVSNPKEARKLMETEYQKQLAKQIRTALLQFQQKLSITPNKILN